MTAPCASRLGNMLTLAHFGALAFVKYADRNNGCWPTTTPKPETFTKNQQQMQQQISKNWECLSSFQCFRFIEGHWKSIIKECLSSFQCFGISEAVLKFNYWGMSQLISIFLIHRMPSKINYWGMSQLISMFRGQSGDIWCLWFWGVKFPEKSGGQKQANFFM